MTNTYITSIGGGRFKKKSAVCRLPSAVSSTIPHSAFRIPRSQGFTLLELMTVMVIMFILMGMATLAMRGIIRGAGISGGIAIVRSQLMKARSQAIFKNQPTAVIFSQDGSTNSMQVVMSFGTVDTVVGGGFTTVGDLPWTADELDESPVYNFDGEQGTLHQGGQPSSQSAFASSGLNWSPGDQVALAIGNPEMLPQGIGFDAGSFPVVISFEPDGSSPSGSSSLAIVELNVSNAQTIPVDVLPSGIIEIGGP